MKVLFASDHAGFELKEKLFDFVKNLGHEAEDVGAASYDEADDYPDLIAPLSKRVSEEPDELRGIIIGGSGQGEAMVANRFRGVRAGVYYGEGGEQTDSVGKKLDVIASMREHNNTNVLSLGARFLSTEEAQKAVQKWLETDFGAEERHVRRIGKIDAF